MIHAWITDMNKMPENATLTTRFRGRLRDCLNPAGSAGGAYLLAGLNCPCCGINACPVGMASAVAVGGAVALLSRLRRFGPPRADAGAHCCSPTGRGADLKQ